MAYQTVAGASKRARLLVHVVTNRHQTGDAARELEREIKKGIADAASVFEDAMRSAPAWLTTHPIPFVEPHSEIGLNVTGTLRSTQMRIHGGRYKARWGRVGQLLGRVSARLALWLDPGLETQLSLPKRT